MSLIKGGDDARHVQQEDRTSQGKKKSKRTSLGGVLVAQSREKGKKEGCSTRWVTEFKGKSPSQHGGNGARALTRAGLPGK